MRSWLDTGWAVRLALPALALAPAAAVPAVAATPELAAARPTAIPAHAAIFCRVMEASPHIAARITPRYRSMKNEDGR
jgi:hypothetical protein